MTKTRTSPIKLDEFWPYQAVVLADQISRHTLSVVKKRAGLNLSQWRVLAAVADQPGRSAADVTSVTPMDKTIVSRAVASLIDTGLIGKTPTNDDKRRHSLTLTDTGQMIYADISKELSSRLLETIPNEVSPEGFVRQIKTYITHLKSIAQAD